MSKQLIRSVTIDTLTGIMNEMYMTSLKRPTHDKWFDWGQGIWQLHSDLQELGFDCILIIGDPGTGKSSGMRTLDPNTNIWFNADNKNPVWIGGSKEYGKKNNPRAPYHMIPKSYADIINHIKGGLEKGMFADQRYAILTGHTEEFRQGHEVKYRLKVLGNLSTKMQLEGRFETVLYSKVLKEGTDTRYVLETQNDGFNTVRSPQGLFEPVIENDYKFVLDKLDEF